MIAVVLVVFVLSFVGYIVARLLTFNWRSEWEESKREVDAEIVTRRAEMLTHEAERIVALEREVARLRGLDQ